MSVQLQPQHTAVASSPIQVTPSLQIDSSIPAMRCIIQAMMNLIQDFNKASDHLRAQCKKEVANYTNLSNREASSLTKQAVGATVFAVFTGATGVLSGLNPNNAFLKTCPAIGDRVGALSQQFFQRGIAPCVSAKTLAVQFTLPNAQQEKSSASQGMETVKQSIPEWMHEGINR